MTDVKAVLSYKISELSLFFLLLNVSTIYSYFFPRISMILLIIAGGLSLLSLLFLMKYKINKICFLLILTWFFIYLIPTLVNGFTASFFNYFIKVLVIFIDLWNLKVNKKDIVRCLFKICFIFTLWSLINSFIFLFPVKLPVFQSFFTSWGGKYDLYLGIFMKNTSRITLLNHELFRMHVPFSEPGNAQMFYNFGFACCLFENKKSKKNMIFGLLFLCAVIFSFSLTGYMIAICLTLIYLIKNQKVLLYLPVLLVTISIAFILINDKLSSVSYSERYADTIYIFKSAYRNLPFGIGIGNSDKLDPLIFENGEIASASFYSGLISPLVIFGFFSFYYYFLLILSCKYFFGRNIWSNVAFSFYLLISLATEPQALANITSIFFISSIINYSTEISHIHRVYSRNPSEKKSRLYNGNI